MNKLYFPALLALFALLPQETSADTPAQPSEPSQAALLDEVVVTASRGAETRQTLSANVAVIGRTEIDQSPSRNVAELLAEQGLGHIQRYPGALTSVGVRGFRTDSHGNDLQGKVLVLLDGRRAGTGNLAKLATKNVARVEVIRGPGAVQYGSAGMGGVINVITRQGRENSLFVEAGAGSFGLYEGSLGGTALLDKLDFAGTLTSSSQDDYDTGSGATYPNTGTGRETGLSANLGYSFSENNRVGLIFTGADVNGAGSPSYFSAPDLDDTTDKYNYSFDLNYQGQSENGRRHWLLRTFVGKDKNSWSDPLASNPDGWDDGIDTFNETDQFGAQAQYSATFAGTTITTGLDWLNYEVENSWNPRESSYTNPALFLLARTTLFERLTVNGGLRQDWYEVEMKDPAGNTEDQSRLTPQIGMALVLQPGLKLRAQYAQAFMMPSADQLGADYQSFAGRIKGNPNLDPESSDTWEAGIEWEIGAMQSSFGYFSTRFEDKIVSDYLADGTSTWKNLGDSSIEGIEFQASYDLGVPLGLTWELRPAINATILTRYEDESTGKDLLYTSGTDLAASLVADNGAGTFIRLNVRYTGSQDVQDWESGSYPAPLVELDAFTVADLSAAWCFYENERTGSWTLQGRVRNLFDEDYSYVKGFPMPGRSFFLGLRWDF